MKRKILLDKIAKYKTNYIDKSFLDREDWLIELLLTLDNSLLEYGINILNLYKDDNLAYEAINLLKKHNNREVGKCLTNILAIKKNISLKGAILLGESKSNFNLANACDVICNKTSIEEDIALEGVKIINNSNNWFNAYYARYPLTSNIAIKNDIALEGARIINTSEEAYKAFLTSTILCSNYVLQNKIALEIVNKINASSNWEEAKKIIDSYFDDDIDWISKDHLYKDEEYSLILNKAVRTKIRKY